MQCDLQVEHRGLQGHLAKLLTDKNSYDLSHSIAINSSVNLSTHKALALNLHIENCLNMRNIENESYTSKLISYEMTC